MPTATASTRERLQFAELIAYGNLSMTFYLVFKACEHVLVERMCARRTAVVREIG